MKVKKPSIAARISLIAVGVAAKAGLAALAGGGGNSSKQASVSGGSFTPNNSYMQERAVTVQVEGRIKGNDNSYVTCFKTTIRH